jgi:hypothetical protein
MRTVLVGSDFMYDKDGELRPIEINTGIGWHRYKLEDNDTALDLTELKEFIIQKQFTKIVYIGLFTNLDNKLSKICTDLSINYEFIRIDFGAMTIPFIEDNDETLIIRSAYDNTAVVDDEYCRDKIEFMKLIQNESYGSQFAYKDINGNLINNITNIIDNGNHPNFILKYRYPGYNKLVYPKFFRVTNQEELNSIFENLNDEYFLMEFLYNSNKLYENHIQLTRSLNILFPPNLESIPIGKYTVFCTDSVDTDSNFSTDTFELIGSRKKYLTNDDTIKTPKLQDTDWVVMSDGTLKSAEDLQIGDEIKTIDIPTSIDILDDMELANFKINFSELETETTYSTNKVLDKQRVNIWCNVTKIVFTDGSDWLDTENAKYLSIKNGEVRFLTIKSPSPEDTGLKIGDSIILLNTSNLETPTFIQKEVQSIENVQEFFGGWEITVEREHLFLTRASAEDDTSYVAIEHNALPTCAYSWGTPCYYTLSECTKTYPYCCPSEARCKASCTGPQGCNLL